MGIFTPHHPHEAPDLMKYGATIQDLAARGHIWCYYDEKINTKRSISAAGVAKILDVPRGYYFKFHRRGYCSGSSFKQSCSKCDGPHRAIICNFHAFSKRNASHLPNQCSNEVASSQIIPQPTSTGASNTCKQ